MPNVRLQLASKARLAVGGVRERKAIFKVTTDGRVPQVLIGLVGRSALLVSLDDVIAMGQEK